MHPEDSQLIAEFLSGEGAAVERVRSWIEQALRSHRLSSVGREDVVQEVLLELTVLLRRGAFRGEARLRTYLWKVANHVCLNCLRAHALRRCSALEAHAPRLVAAPDDLVASVDRAQSLDRLEAVARRMPEECRQLWALLLQGFSYEEMGVRLGLAEGTLRVRALRCRRKAAALWDAVAGRSGSGRGAARRGQAE